jgi:integrase
MFTNNNAVAPIEQDYSNVISLKVIKGNKDKKNEVKYNKDGSVKKIPRNKIAGKDSEVYAFRTTEEISEMINVFDKHINESTNETQRQIACRNKLLFIIGINVGIRASDLRTLKWSFFYTRQDDGSLKFKSFYTLQPMKQRKQKKFVKLFFNQTVQNAITNYISEYPFENLDEYLFASRKGGEPIIVSSLWKIIKNTAAEAGIEQNIGSHSLRKTFGFWCWHQAEDKNKALVILQQIFNHSTTQVTSRYIGILDDEIENMFNSIELGLDMI